MSDVPAAPADPPRLEVLKLSLLPFFAEPCTYCVKPRLLLTQLAGHIRCCELTAHVRRLPDSPIHDTVESTAFSVHHNCPKCHGSGWVLTDTGRFVLWLAKEYWDCVRPEWQTAGAEIPF